MHLNQLIIITLLLEKEDEPHRPTRKTILTSLFLFKTCQSLIDEKHSVCTKKLSPKCFSACPKECVPRPLHNQIPSILSHGWRSTLNTSFPLPCRKWRVDLWPDAEWVWTEFRPSTGNCLTPLFPSTTGAILLTLLWLWESKIQEAQLFYTKIFFKVDSNHIANERKVFWVTLNCIIFEGVFNSMSILMEEMHQWQTERGGRTITHFKIWIYILQATFVSFIASTLTSHFNRRNSLFTV